MVDRLAELLMEKSQELNLFSAGDRLKIAEKHIPDSLAVLNFWEVQDGMKILDIGTGGGLPGLALAEACSTLSFTLMDSTEKKVRAVHEMADDLNLLNVRVVTGRFEALAHQNTYREQFDIVTARAVAALPTLLEYAAGFLKVGGFLYSWKGPGYEVELTSSEKAQKALGLGFVQAFEYSLPAGEHRFILQFEKKGHLAESYPRKDGVPSAKPL